VGEPAELAHDRGERGRHDGGVEGREKEDEDQAGKHRRPPPGGYGSLGG